MGKPITVGWVTAKVKETGESVHAIGLGPEPNLPKINSAPPPAPGAGIFHSPPQVSISTRDHQCILFVLVGIVVEGRTDHDQNY
jgi:hypothetical protein